VITPVRQGEGKVMTDEYQEKGEGGSCCVVFLMVMETELPVRHHVGGERGGLRVLSSKEEKKESFASDEKRHDHFFQLKRGSANTKEGKGGSTSQLVSNRRKRKEDCFAGGLRDPPGKLKKRSCYLICGKESFFSHGSAWVVGKKVKEEGNDCRKGSVRLWGGAERSSKHP